MNDRHTTDTQPLYPADAGAPAAPAAPDEEDAGSGNRWEPTAAPAAAPTAAPTETDLDPVDETRASDVPPAPNYPPPTGQPSYPPPATGAYPVLGAPVPKRRRARSAAAVAAAAVVAGIGGFALGHATGGDDVTPASTTVGDGTGQAPGEGFEGGRGQFGDGQRPDGPPPGGFGGDGDSFGQGQMPGQGTDTQPGTGDDSAQDSAQS